MNKLATSFALLAFGGVSLITPAFAAPGGGMMSGQGGGQGAGVDCKLNPTDPACTPGRGHRDRGGQMNNGNMAPNSGSTNQGSTSNSGGGSNRGGMTGGNMSGSNNNGNMSGSNNDRGGNNNQMGSNDNRGGNDDRDHGPRGPMGGPPHGDWRHRFPGYNFGYFAAPNFAITLGTLIPNSYGLKPVPRFIWEQPGYHRYRGFLYFTTRDGDFVIVTPGPRHRIVRVISDF